MVSGNYISNDGKEKSFSIEDGDDTNLLLGCWKSAFTVMRSQFQDESKKKKYEYWVKCPALEMDWAYLQSRMVVMGFDAYGCYTRGGIDFNRPSDFPQKITFDSGRTAFYETLDADQYRRLGWLNTISYWQAMSNFVGNWKYAGSSDDHPSGNFDLFGYVFTRNYDHKYDVIPYYDVMLHCSLSPQDVHTLALVYKDVYSRQFEYEDIYVFFSGKIAEIRNFEVISNNTPDQNTYYVAIENKKGELLDVKTTTTFGVTVGSVASEFADRMSESQKNTRVVDDLVIRI